MFLGNQKKEQLKYYKEMLATIGSLSHLFSAGKEPYIAYRIAENLFCKSFEADNLSRTDCSADASKDKLGIGIKTFLEKNGASLQKIAEFNREHELFKDLNCEQKIYKIADMRNKRIKITKRMFGLDTMIYHCITRKPGGIIVYEQPMDEIQISRIKGIKTKKNTIVFKDGINEYSFNVAKSTLYKRFLTASIFINLSVKILQDPFVELEKMFAKTAKALVFAPIRKQQYVILPLYSIKSRNKYVPDKSGLNQWNASGRSRHVNEAYIRIPAWLHRSFRRFFPPRNKHFKLLLPDGNEMKAKLCQDGAKALMSKHNADLGKWILRDILDLPEGELLTYEKLEEIGVDSVVIYKIGHDKFDIDFTKTGSYEEFEENNKA